MRVSVHLLFSFAASVICKAVSQQETGALKNQLSVKTTSGHVHGIIDPRYARVRQFLGIPYAQAPLGDLRWRAPQALTSSDMNKTVNATRLPPSCLQFLASGASVYTRDVLEFNLQGLNRTGDISEDCLTLSVWSPIRHEHHRPWTGGIKLLPVLLFIYGGGFSTGGQNVPYQVPTQWVQRSPDHLVVSFNYRLSIWGYPNAAGISADEQNVGLLDQRAAVEWVRDNIAAFGGDPQRIVLWGQSAGSESVDFFNFAYPSDPIVSGLIMDSGTAQTHSGAAPDHASFSYVASQVGCGGFASDAQSELACMRNISASVIEEFLAQHANSHASPALGFPPMTDNRTVFANYTARALLGKQAQIPAIIGTNSEDGVPFTAYDPDGPNKTAALIAGLNTFFCDSTQTTKLRQQTNLSTFKYYYSGNFSNISPESWLGAYHSSELPMLFGTYGNYRGLSSPLEDRTSRAMQRAYVAFATNGMDGLRSTGWREYDKLGESSVRNFGNVSAGPAQDISLSFLEDLCNGTRANIH